MRLAVRTLVAAVFIAGLLTPVASAQWGPQVVHYDDLRRNGGSVFGYTNTDIDMSQCWTFTGCWDEYTSFAGATLYKNCEFRSGDYDTNWNWFSQVWVYDTADAGEWQLYTYNALEDVEWEDYYGSHYYEALLQDNVWRTLTINLEISISGEQYVYDGDAGYFDVWPQLGTPTWYQWSFSYTFPAGNNPYVTFDNPDDTPTLTDAHWYAYPNEECSAGWMSVYTITATVGFGNLQASQDTGLWVEVPWWGGVTYAPVVRGNPDWGLVNGTWKVTSVSNPFMRDAPATYIDIPSSSQFYNKAAQHENVHVGQWGPGGIFTIAHVYDVQDLWDQVRGLTDNTEAGLITKIALAELVWEAQSENLFNAVVYDAEIEAYGVSDYVNPRYIYQNCWQYW